MQEQEESNSMESENSNSEATGEDDDSDEFNFEEEFLVKPSTITTKRQLQLQAKKLAQTQPDVVSMKQKVSNTKSQQKSEQTVQTSAEKNSSRKKPNLRIPLSNPAHASNENMTINGDAVENKTNGSFVVTALDYKMSMDDKPVTSLDSPFGVQQIPSTFNNFPKSITDNTNTQNKNAPTQPLTFNKEELPLPSPFLPLITPITNANKGQTFDFQLSAAKKDAPLNKDSEEQGKNGNASCSNFDFFVNFSFPLPSPGFLYSSKGFTTGPLDSCNRGNQFRTFTFDEVVIEGDNKNHAYEDVIEKKVHKNSFI